MKYTRSLFTLIEVLVAMTLISLLMTTLLFFYKEVVLIGKEGEGIVGETFKSRYIANRLADVVPKALSPSDPLFAFFSSPSPQGGSGIGEGCLIFAYHNGVSLNKALANEVLGRLTIDDKERLVLYSWPLKGDDSSCDLVNKEVLMDNVSGLTFAFFIGTAYSQEEKEKGIKPSEDLGCWRTLPWQKEFQLLPAMVKIIIERKQQDPLTFIFPLANSTSHIIYDSQ